jgi:citrate synthase
MGNIFAAVVVCRGYPIQELTEASYLESAYLVVYGNLPSR